MVKSGGDTTVALPRFKTAKIKATINRQDQSVFGGFPK
jgi:hypothetical protein